jgi:predicted nuclease of predicted toxin-antitoxin system
LQEKSWSTLLTSNLRLLLDEAVTNPLAQMIRESSSALNIQYVRELPGVAGTEDKNVVAYAKKEDRIVVTTETGINHRKFRICTHPGIIVLGGKHRHETIHAEAFKNFLLSGHRQQANHAVTFVTEKQVRIKTNYTDPDIIIDL